METATVWWVMTGVFVALEMLSGTFYLLMLATGMVMAAIMAHLGFDVGTQLIVCALVSGGAVVAWHRQQPRKRDRQAQRNHDMHIDIGSRVDVEQWDSPQATSVLHRGTTWSARLDTQGLPSIDQLKTGAHRIVAIDGNTLVLEKMEG